MKLLHCLSLCCLMILHCASPKAFKTIKHHFREEFVVNVSGMIPPNYIELRKIEAHNNDFDIEYHYIYSDSSIIYISNAKSFTFPNYNNIKDLNSTESTLRVQDDDFIVETNKILIANSKPPLPRAPYNMSFSGVDKRNLFWKDIKFGNISVGYLKVSTAKKDLFDEALNSFKVK